MCAEFQGITFLDNLSSVGVVRTEELPHHRKCRSGSDNDSIRVFLDKDVNIGGVVRLHMLYD
jgi:hypothetical protein